MAIDPITLTVLVVIVAAVVALIVWAVRRKNRPAAAGTVAPSGRMNVLAIVGFVMSFFLAVPAVVLAHVGLAQINRTGDSGRGFAVAALWIGYVSIAVTLILIFVVPYYLSQGRY